MADVVAIGSAYCLGLAAAGTAFLERGSQLFKILLITLGKIAL